MPWRPVNSGHVGQCRHPLVKLPPRAAIHVKFSFRFLSYPCASASPLPCLTSLFCYSRSPFVHPPVAKRQSCLRLLGPSTATLHRSCVCLLAPPTGNQQSSWFLLFAHPTATQLTPFVCFVAPVIVATTRCIFLPLGSRSTI